jgi:hypothetical protein
MAIQSGQRVGHGGRATGRFVGGLGGIAHAAKHLNQALTDCGISTATQGEKISSDRGCLVGGALHTKAGERLWRGEANASGLED